MSNLTESHRRWLAFYLICFGDFMIVLDLSIVNVALPAIKAALGFSDTHLAWIVNAYMLTYSGLLLMGGRLGDVFGQKRVFMAGLVLFILASLACGLSPNQTTLIVARAIQGVGGAVLSAVAFSYVLVLFTEPHERVKAMGIFGFIMAGGGAVGVFLGGVVTDYFGWSWIFLINVPVGILVLILGSQLLPKTTTLPNTPIRLDWLGSVLITLAMLVFVYAIINANTLGGTSWSMLVLCSVAFALLAAFLAWERHFPVPIMPFSIFNVANITLGMFIGGLWSSAMFAAFFMISINLEEILHYTPLQIGLAFLPTNIVMALVSIFLSAHCVAKWGARWTLAVGLMLLALTMVIFAIMPADAAFVVYILPAMLLFGFGSGLAMNPLLFAATAFVPADENGLASGILNSTFSIGGTLGLSLLVSLSAQWHQHQLTQGLAEIPARLAGFHLAYWLAVGLLIIAVALALKMTEPAPPNQALS